MVRNGWLTAPVRKEMSSVRVSWGIHIISESVLRPATVAFREALFPNLHWLGTAVILKKRNAFTQFTEQPASI